MRVRGIWSIAAVVAGVAACAIVLGCSESDGVNPTAPELSASVSPGGYRAIWQQLDLTDAQRVQLAALREKHRQQMKELRANAGELRNQEGVAEARSSLRDQMHDEVSTILSPDQRARLEQLRAERRAEFNKQGWSRHSVRGEFRAEHQPKRLGRLAEVLALTAEQQAQVTAVFEDLRPANDMPRLERRQARVEHRTQVETRLKAILTDEQFEKFLGIRAERGASKRSWRSPH